MLLPLWRTNPTYLALRHSHNRYERVHHHWRQRYRVAADDHALRPKRRGIDCQQLRSNAALLIEWLIILSREGWLGSQRKAARALKRGKRILVDDILNKKVTKGIERFGDFRSALGLAGPYGPKASAVGIGELTPTAGLLVTRVTDPDIEPRRRTPFPFELEPDPGTTS